MEENVRRARPIRLEIEIIKFMRNKREFGVQDSAMRNVFDSHHIVLPFIRVNFK